MVVKTYNLSVLFNLCVTGEVSVFVWNEEYVGSSPTIQTNIPIEQWLVRQTFTLKISVRIRVGIPIASWCNGNITGS